MPPAPSASASVPEVELDAAQRAIVDLPDDASGVVVGAAGAGKTEVVVARVVRLLQGGFAPHEVLVLTPTRQGATELRDRLALAVEVATPGPLARSVAAFAYALVRAAAVRAGAEPPQLLTGPDEDQILQDLLTGDADDERHGRSRWPDWLGADIRATQGFRAELRAFLAECVTLGVEPSSLPDIARDESLPVWESVASFAAEYQRVRARMRGAHRDAAGMVREALGIVRGGVPERLDVRVILVDDAQELTAGGVDLLDALRERGVAVLAFGDPDVGSGAFRGASPENFARLAAGSTLHVLDGAHRGTPAQHDLLAHVTARIGAAGVVAHRRPTTGDAAVATDASVQAFALRSAAEQYDTIARLLRERHVHDGVPWAQCAVIAHDTRQVTALEAELAARDVPTGGVQGRTLGERSAIREVLRTVELAALPVDQWGPDDVTDALRGAGFDPIALRRLRTTLRHASARATDAEDAPLPSGRELLASAMAHPIEFELLDTREGRQAARVAGTIAALRTQLAEAATAHELLWTVWESSGRQRVWTEAAAGHGPLAEQARRDIDALVALFQAAKRHGEREDDTSALAFIRGILDSDVAEDRLSAPPAGDAVRIMTPAAALGTEFDTVVIAGVQDGVWPNLRTRGSLLETWRLATIGQPTPDVVDRRRAVLHDELRLFARAVSRARTHLVVTAVDDDDTGPSALFEFLPPAQPAPVSAEHPLSLRGLVARHRRTLTAGRASAVERQHAAGQLALLAAAEVDGADPTSWYGIAEVTSGGARDAEEAVRVSPSRLEAIETCQLDWLIGDLGGDAGSTVAGIGTIIHAALEHAAGADEDELWRTVEARWGELEFEAPWRDRAEQTRARDLIRRLALYLRRFEASGGALLGAEPRFEVPLPDRGTGLAVLSGFIDRVELTPEGTVVIVDLKTGKREPQTDAKVADHPQLAAYQLAFESGAIEAASGKPSGGAKLLVLRPTAASKDYVEPRQLPFDDETRAAFLGRVADAVAVMRGETFLAPYEDHCRDDHTYGLCRIHTIAAVSAS